MHRVGISASETDTNRSRSSLSTKGRELSQQEVSLSPSHKRELAAKTEFLPLAAHLLLHTVVDARPPTGLALRLPGRLMPDPSPASMREEAADPPACRCFLCCRPQQVASQR